MGRSVFVTLIGVWVMFSASLGDGFVEVFASMGDDDCPDELLPDSFEATFLGTVIIFTIR